VMVLFSAYSTEVIGIHALFGAFLAGILMPGEPKIRQWMMDQVEAVSTILLLPLFFVLTGLHTEIGLFNGAGFWTAGAWIFLVAVVGKFGGTTFASRLIGLGWTDSLSMGALMNTRGLVELIILQLGYDLGMLSPAIFSLFLIMALLTTAMTGPTLHIIERFKHRDSTPDLRQIP